MGERKVLNKYYPPDFDPSLIPRRKLGKNRVFQVRMMLPMSVCCNTCGEYMYRGKKFNSKKEDVEGDDGEYLGIRKYRFIMKCSKCNAEFSIMTDPKNGDYACEVGVSRNYELWKEEATHDDEVKKSKEEEEEGDAMRRLENRTEDSKREMDQLDALDEIKALNKRHEKVDTIGSLHALHADQSEHDAELAMARDEAKIKALFGDKTKVVGSAQGEGGKPFIKRLDDGIEEEDEGKTSLWGSSVLPSSTIATKSDVSSQSLLGVKLKKKPAVKRKVEEADEDERPAMKKKIIETPVVSLGGLGLLVDYGSDDSS